MHYMSHRSLLWLALVALLLPGPGEGLARMPEICDNARDDDGDGLVDLNDTDCNCPKLEPVSLIPNPSFEESNCCPNNRSQLNCADTWIQASEATTDYLHACGWMGWENLPPPLPFPDGQACVGFRNGRFNQQVQPNWKEYAGACLLGPLRAGTPYRIRFNIGFTHAVNSPPTEVVLYGSTDCKNLPFGVGNPNHGCPTNGPGWIRLGGVFVSGTNTWITTQINTVPPEVIYAVAIGPSCVEETATTDLYYFLDNLVLDKQEAFDFQISARGHPCSDEFYLEAPQSDTLSYQWYKNGVALVGATKPSLPVKRAGEGRYQLRVSSRAGCKVLQPFDYRIPRFTTVLNQYICAGDRYAFASRSLGESGSYESLFKTRNNCDSLVQLNLRVVDAVYDTVDAHIFEGENYQFGPRRYHRPGQYQGQFTSTIGCDSLVTLHLNYYDVYFPTAFSPNGDGINDAFTVFGGGDLRGIVSLQVFDRWGGLVFAGKGLPPNDAAAGWNGARQGQTAPPGLYVYVARLLMDDGKEHVRYGEVVLMR